MITFAINFSQKNILLEYDHKCFVWFIEVTKIKGYLSKINTETKGAQ